MSQIEGIEKESIFKKLTEGLKSIFIELSVNEQAGKMLEEISVEEIQRNENKELIENLEKAQEWKNTISLKDTENLTNNKIVLEVNVSEEIAQKQADQVKTNKQKEIDSQNQIGR